MTSLSTIITLCKRRGFIFPGSELYGGLAGTFDYGPLGYQVKQNIQKEWWRYFVSKRPRECIGLDTGILLSPKVWENSGHVNNFSDPLSECSECKKRTRADHHVESILKNYAKKENTQLMEEVKSISNLNDQISKLKQHNFWACPHCKSSNGLSLPKQFNLMFSTKVGAATSDGDVAYFRPETAQGVYINLPTITSVLIRKNKKLPFGVGQIGKAFRNEISPRDFIFRTREFEQLELQWFCEKEESSKWHEYWVNECVNFCTSVCGLESKSIQVRKHLNDELAHYSLATSDLEYKYPFGFGEFWGISNRGDHDLKCHSLTHLFQDNCHVVEPSLGLNRLLLALLCSAYQYDAEHSRVVLKLKPNIAPYECAVFPVITNNEDIMHKAKGVFDLLMDWEARVDYDDASTSIGKKYRRHDEIGTLITIVIDDQTLKDDTVTFRHRDTMKQIRGEIFRLYTATKSNDSLKIVPKVGYETKSKFYATINQNF